MQIYHQLVSLFGARSESSPFLMEFPRRVPDVTSDAYPVTGPYSAMAKPQVVSEAESRLTDSMFHLPDLGSGVGVA